MLSFHVSHCPQATNAFVGRRCKFATFQTDRRPEMLISFPSEEKLPSPSVSSRNVRRSQRRAFRAWWSGQLLWPSWASRPMPACSVMPAAISSPTTATIRGRSRPISGIAIFRTRRATRRWRHSGSRNFFASDQAMSWDSRSSRSCIFIPMTLTPVLRAGHTPEESFGRLNHAFERPTPAVRIDQIIWGKAQS
jgi:hypothetical protein